ncbi:MAG: hypothetical protein K2X51_12600 [Burkholderiales bacterium]|nr:hypothetical protein [Burkholderiales bacterium]
MAQSAPPGAAAPKKAARTVRRPPSTQAATLQPAAALSYARSMGFAFLTPEEHQLIDRLRFTTLAGRAIVHDMARVIQRRHPWVDADLEHNTSPTL